VIKNARFKNDLGPIDESCQCPVCCGGYTRAYLRHLFVAGEILALRLLSQHNIHYYQELVRGAREAVLAGTFEPWQSETLSRLRSSETLAV
jgi:queuine tRNA-ribosyltransferase